MIHTLHTGSFEANGAENFVGQGQKLGGATMQPSSSSGRETPGEAAEDVVGTQQAAEHVHEGNNMKSNVLGGRVKQNVDGDIRFGSYRCDPPPQGLTNKAFR